MKRASLIGLIALVPASLNAAPPVAGELVVLVCGGGTQATTLMGLRENAPIPAVGACCAKGCHGARKRGNELEPEE